MRRLPEIGMALGVAATSTGVVAEGLNIFTGFRSQFQHMLSNPVLLDNLHYDTLSYTALTLELAGIAIFAWSDYKREKRNRRSLVNTEPVS